MTQQASTVFLNILTFSANTEFIQRSIHTIKEIYTKSHSHHITIYPPSYQIHKNQYLQLQQFYWWSNETLATFNEIYSHLLCGQ